ncbi:MBL fold metallo-hydrolase [Ureibacillus composti]|nr:MBL fold metallo-hydrolase [Ureibacillus composti]
MLSFIGCGSAFNTELGNNSAFIKKGRVLLLIDCGSSTFSKIHQSHLLKDVEEICVLLTHTHPDHVGSLGDLIFYGYYAMGTMAESNVHVYAPKKLKIKELLKMMGVEENTYKLTEFATQDAYQYEDFEMTFEAVPVNHVKDLDCYSYILHYENKAIYYSGDCSDIPNHILEWLHDGKFDVFYQDTCKADYNGNPHLSLRKLDDLIEWKIRDRVYCMHLDAGFPKDIAIKMGFNIVEPIKSYNLE